MKRLTEEDKLLARLAVGFHGPLRYYRLLESLGYAWAIPAREKIDTIHNRSMADLNRSIQEIEAA